MGLLRLAPSGAEDEHVRNVEVKRAEEPIVASLCLDRGPAREGDGVEALGRLQGEREVLLRVRVPVNERDDLAGSWMNGALHANGSDV